MKRLIWFVWLPALVILCLFLFLNTKKNQAEETQKQDFVIEEIENTPQEDCIASLISNIHEKIKEEHILVEKILNKNDEDTYQVVFIKIQKPEYCCTKMSCLHH